MTRVRRDMAEFAASRTLRDRDAASIVCAALEMPADSPEQMRAFAEAAALFGPIATREADPQPLYGAAEVASWD